MLSIMNEWSNSLRRRSSGVERFLGKEKVTSSILVVGSKQYEEVKD